MSTSAKGKGGLGLASTITLIFIVLKLIGVIDWSWFWVFSPLIVSGAIFLVICVFLLIAVAAVFGLSDD